MKLFTFFFYFCVIFALLDLDTDPGTPLNPDPDPQQYLRVSALLLVYARYCGAEYNVESNAPPCSVSFPWNRKPILDFSIPLIESY